MSAAEVAIDSMSKAGAMAMATPSGTATCPEGKIRMGVFFDGTDNNQWRDWPNGARYAATNGTTKGPTNVAKLWRVYIDIGDIQKRVYHHGPGSDSDGTKGTKDAPANQQPTDSDGKLDAGTPDTTSDWRGKLFGAGGKARTTWGLKHLSVFFSKNTNPLAQEKLVDVYGFSRGSAIGRDFINRALLEGVDNLNDKSGFRYIEIPGGGEGGGTTMVRVPAYVRHQHVIFNFLGIFDTVASFGLAGKELGNDLANYNFFVDHNVVRHTVHMIAEDEVRSLFPVSSLFMDPKNRGSQKPSDYSSSMVELWYPGAHSDVGGSYLREEAVAEIPATTERTFRDLWIHSHVVPAVPAVPEKKPELAHIPLRDMHKASVDQGVPLNPLSAMGADCLWQIPGPLLTQYNAYDTYRSRTPFNIGARYIQNFIIDDYVKLYHEQRDAAESVKWLQINYMHDTRMPVLDKGERHKRTVLYMGPQPATAPQNG